MLRSCVIREGVTQAAGKLAHVRQEQAFSIHDSSGSEGV